MYSNNWESVYVGPRRPPLWIKPIARGRQNLVAFPYDLLDYSPKLQNLYNSTEAERGVPSYFSSICTWERLRYVIDELKSFDKGQNQFFPPGLHVQRCAQDLGLEDLVRRYQPQKEIYGPSVERNCFSWG